MNPLVSIITPVLNGEKYLRECLASVACQTYPRVEHIIVDGGSTDNTIRILQTAQSTHPGRVRFISENDKGVGDAVNKGFSLARGEILGWIDSDDYYNETTIESVVKFFDINRSAMFVYGGCDVIDENGKPFDKYPIKATQKRNSALTFTIKDFNAREALDDWAYIVFCSAFYRKQVIQSVGGLNSLGNDLDLWLRVNEQFRMYRIDDVLANWRLHTDSISGGNKTVCDNRLREDCMLSFKFGGNPFANRPSRYYGLLASRLLKRLPNLIQPSIRNGWYRIKKKGIVNGC